MNYLQFCQFICVFLVLMDGRVREGGILPGCSKDNQNAIRNVMVEWTIVDSRIRICSKKTIDVRTDVRALAKKLLLYGQTSVHS